MTNVKLKLFASKKSSARAGRESLAWLESLGGLKVERWLAAYRVTAELGDWGDVYLRVTASGDTVNRAADRCAEKLEAMLAEGVVRL